MGHPLFVGQNGVGLDLIVSSYFLTMALFPK
jgi:hypothetical protein